MLVTRFLSTAVQIAVDDKRLARLVRRCHELPGQRLFQYVDETGERTITTIGERLEPAGIEEPGDATLQVAIPGSGNDALVLASITHLPFSRR